jgi:hypothetical protein
LITTISMAQLPLGKFQWQWGDSMDELIILRGNRFSYTVSGCVTLTEGYGRYKVNGKKLFLYFDKKDTATILPTITFHHNNSDTTVIRMTFLDMMDTSRVQYVSALIKRGGQSINRGTRASEKGEGVLKIANAWLPVEIETSMVSARNKTIAIDSAGEYDVIIPIQLRTDMLVDPGVVMEFEIKEANATRMLMKRKGARNFVSYDKRED